ncbi:related to acyl-CoA thiolesterase [Claviceps purpurea 20.1]|uniref:Related to acyl-CoA thiolesterase n=1 Tax=Claviceps purpurea (strain 20.1) TaxID=1111077 RepID=M1VW90_CLAP2|nr:hypothetical protein E4U12_004567 [Claviceps purpurea]KAG6192899.1 hypothetical protein E4U10_003990 [Claviceps purpurea]KAG6262970.1 hypothetical protein E4U48_006987 [Claviceps purpurea]KAG6293743.1 hypothetical protein E4U46_007229 [Claviceps purpurea]CCE30857.1 related to acyl-CoA thiolesterase [Claviceps purpurea 20.1]
MPPEERTTLLRPPPPNPSLAPIENILQVTPVSVLGPDIFTNTRKAWVPSGARGIYGGTVIAQCLAAAQKTVPEGFLPHSCHCYFLLAGSGSVPILFHVERVRDGRSYVTRTVQARQRGSCIFTTTISFVREGAGAGAGAGKGEGVGVVRHAVELPEEAKGSLPEGEYECEEGEWGGPFQHVMVPMPAAPTLDGKASGSGKENGKGNGIGDGRKEPHQIRCQQWMRCRGKISAEGGLQAHLNALAYISDSGFVGTVARVHHLWRLPFPPQEYHALPEEQKRRVEHVARHEGLGDDPEGWKALPHLGMMVSLDHSIYFHAPGRVRADEWMFADMDSPWAGDGRGFVTQRIFARDGTLLATCVQEGVVRLAPSPEKPKL